MGGSEPRAMNCPRCKHSLHVLDAYCPSCGKQLDYSWYERKKPHTT